MFEENQGAAVRRVELCEEVLNDLLFSLDQVWRLPAKTVTHFYVAVDYAACVYSLFVEARAADS